MVKKKWKCDKCAKRYAVQSDWKAHAKICGTREYRCDCRTTFSRKDSFVTHRAFCDALTDENRKMNHNLVATGGIMLHNQVHELFSTSMPAKHSSSNPDVLVNPSLSHQRIQKTQNTHAFHSAGITISAKLEPSFNASHPGVMKNNSTLTLKMDSGYTSATALLQKAAEMGAKISNNSVAPILLKGFSGYSTISMNSAEMMEGEVRTGEGKITAVDFLGVTAGDHSDLGIRKLS
ncbi:unnamed protein product [Rhodiola kirilowii]